MATFWNDSTGKLEPKRKFRWLVTIGELQETEFYAKTVTRPAWTLGNHQHKFINHTFNYPARVEWTPIDLTYVDPGEPDMAHSFLEILRISGYNWPTSPELGSQTVTKHDAVRALGQVSIKQIGESQGQILDEWILVNGWISEVTSDTLSYEDDGLVEISCKIVYDWAYLNTAGAAANGQKPNYTGKHDL
jgi:hypothetical protein